MRVLSYKYNGLGGYPADKLNIGLIAEDLLQSAPYAIDTFQQRLDSLDTATTLLLGIRNEAILYTSVNAIKELDSMVSTPPSAPALLAPADGDTLSGTRKNNMLAWSNPDNAVYFEVAAALAPDLSSDTLLLSKTLDTAIVPNISRRDTVTVYWRVRAFNGAGFGGWSATGNFTWLPGKGAPSGEPSSPSDVRYKDNIATIDSALEKTLSLRGVYFDWRTQQFPENDFDTSRYMGMIAQEVQAVAPEVVFSNDTGALSLSYGRLVALLVEAIKEQHNLIVAQGTGLDSLTAALNALSPDSLDTRLTALEACVNSLPPGLCGGGNNNGGGQQNKSMGTPGTGPGGLKAELLQNNPNPFSRSTEIAYRLPEEAQQASIYVYDLQGKQVKVFDSLEKGSGFVTLQGGELYAGMFIYTLVVDGKEAGTKRMILTE